MSSFTKTVTGIAETKAEMNRLMREMHGAPMVDAMQDATLYVVGDARRAAPVDTGRYRASIVGDVRVMQETVVGVVGSNVVYAPFIEFGTKPHWPPLAALQVWARRHGTNAYVVARAISQRGTKEYRVLRGAIEKNAEKIVRRLQRAVADIVKG